MKKLFIVLVLLSAIIFPINASAKSYSFGGYYCDAKQPIGDGTFYMTCHILVTSDFEINHIEGNLILKNVKLESIKTSSDWVNNNGLSSSVNFTSATGHSGSFSVADLVFTGNLSDTECEASFEPIIAEKTVENTPNNYVCAIIDNEYYGKSGNVVTEEAYYEECCNYICTVVDNKYYFNSKGKSVSYDEMLEDCSTTETITNPQTGIDYGYILLILGILSIIGIIKFTKKNTKIYKL